MRYLLSLIMLAACVIGRAGEVPLQDFARHPKFRDAKISPDGQYLLRLVGG